MPIQHAWKLVSDHSFSKKFVRKKAPSMYVHFQTHTWIMSSLVLVPPAPCWLTGSLPPAIECASSRRVQGTTHGPFRCRRRLCTTFVMTCTTGTITRCLKSTATIASCIGPGAECGAVALLWTRWRTCEVTRSTMTAGRNKGLRVGLTRTACLISKKLRFVFYKQEE